MSAALKPAKVPPVSTHPYFVQREGGDAVYYRNFKAAQTRILKDIESFKKIWQRLRINDSVAACEDLLEQADQLTPFEDGRVAGLIDPYTGMWYRANLVRRVAV